MHHLSPYTTMASTPHSLFLPIMNDKVIRAEPSGYHVPFAIEQHVDNSSSDLHYGENSQQWPTVISSSNPLSSSISASCSLSCVNSYKRNMAIIQTQAKESFRILVKREVLNSENPMQYDGSDLHGGLGDDHTKLHKRRRYQRRNSVTASILLRQLSGNDREGGAQLIPLNQSSLSRTREIEDEFLNTAAGLDAKETATKRRRMSLA